jgi:hypothetical protein
MNPGKWYDISFTYQRRNHPVWDSGMNRMSSEESINYV